MLTRVVVVVVVVVVVLCLISFRFVYHLEISFTKEHAGKSHINNLLGRGKIKLKFLPAFVDFLLNMGMLISLLLH